MLLEMPKFVMKAVLNFNSDLSSSFTLFNNNKAFLNKKKHSKETTMTVFVSIIFSAENKKKTIVDTGMTISHLKSVKNLFFFVRSFKVLCISESFMINGRFTNEIHYGKSYALFYAQATCNRAQCV